MSFAMLSHLHHPLNCFNSESCYISMLKAWTTQHTLWIFMKRSFVSRTPANKNLVDDLKIHQQVQFTRNIKHSGRCSWSSLWLLQASNIFLESLCFMPLWFFGVCYFCSLTSWCGHFRFFWVARSKMFFGTLKSSRLEEAGYQEGFNLKLCGRPGHFKIHGSQWNPIIVYGMVCQNCPNLIAWMFHFCLRNWWASAKRAEKVTLFAVELVSVEAPYASGVVVPGFCKPKAGRWVLKGSLCYLRGTSIWPFLYVFVRDWVKVF